VKIMRVLFVVFTSLLANVCFADPPAPLPSPTTLQIIGETRVARDRMFRLRPAGAPNDAALIWDVFPEDAADVDDSDPHILRFTAPPGTYKVKLRSISGRDVQTARLTVTVDGQAPTPRPNPTPAPAPFPAPSVANSWLVVVDDTANRTVATGRVLGDLAFWQSLEGIGQHWHVFDKGEAEVTAKGYGAVAAKVGLPALLILGSDGNLLRSVKLPDTTDGVRALVKEVTGK
jgi:hypothetical protein